MAVLGNVPTITNATHSHTMYDGAGTSLYQATGTGGGLGLVPIATTNTVGLCSWGGGGGSDHFENQFHRRNQKNAFVEVMREAQAEKQQEKKVTKSTLRIVQVFIADPNENVPLDDRMIYRGSQHLTDATDQELFFEINITSLLEAHNANRVKIVDKSVKDRTEYLEPVKIRDLRMVVVNVATF